MGSISNPISPNVVVCVGGINGETRSYNLWKNGQTIVIQAAPLVDPSMDLADLWCPPAEMVFRLEREYLYGLEHIQTLLASIEFGKTNWAYMHPHPKGGYHIVQKQKSLYKVRAPTWAPLIEEKEIIYTKWFLVDVRMGHWKGREVDVILGYEDYYLKRVEDTVMGYLALKGLDITYAVVAHVIHTDGSIIGVATEPEVGRLVQFRDRTLVYDAISRLQQRHLIYNGIHYSKIHILHGKVRLSNLASIRYIKDPVELKEEAERRHWRALEQLFNSLDPADEVPQLALERTFKQTTLKLLPEHPSPERPRLVRFLLTTYLPQGIDGRSRFPSGERANGRARKHSVVSPSVELLGFAEMLEVDAADVQDLPFSVQKTSVGIARLTAPKCQAIGCHKTHAFTVSNSCMP